MSASTSSAYAPSVSASSVSASSASASIDTRTRERHAHMDDAAHASVHSTANDSTAKRRTFEDPAAHDDATLNAAIEAYKTRATPRARSKAADAQHISPQLRPYRGFEHFLSLLAPPQCALCDVGVQGIQTAICTPCEQRAQWRRTQLDFGEVWSPFRHAEQARRAVSRLKYHGERWRGAQLAQYCGLSWLAAFEDAIDARDVLIPIPLTSQRIRTRGFNQAQVLIDGLQRRIRLRDCTRTLWRAHDQDRDQKKRTREERLQRDNPFTVRTRLPPNTRVWLVDDVVTTGVTLQQAAQRLQDAGLRPMGAITLTWTR